MLPAILALYDGVYSRAADAKAVDTNAFLSGQRDKGLSQSKRAGVLKMAESWG